MRHALLACALIAAPFAVQAEESAFSYTHADVRYVSADADAVSSDGSGYQLQGSYAFSHHFFVTGRAQYFETEDFTIGTDTGHFRLIQGAVGVGAHHAITPVLDVLGSASYLYGEAEGQEGFSGSGSESASGFELEAGLRMALAPMVEVSGLYTYQEVEFEDADESDDTSFFTLQAEYKFTPNISGIGSIVHGADQDAYTIGARYNF